MPTLNWIGKDKVVNYPSEGAIPCTGEEVQL